MWNIFPTIEEHDEHDGENQAEGHISSPNELSPNFPYIKARSSSTHSTRKISSGKQFVMIIVNLLMIAI